MDYAEKLGYESFKDTDIIDKFDVGGCRRGFNKHKSVMTETDYFYFQIGWDNARFEFSKTIKFNYSGQILLCVQFILNLFKKQPNLLEKFKIALYAAAHRDSLCVELPPISDSLKFVLATQKLWDNDLKLTARGYAVALCLCESDDIKQRVIS